jgi:hypothetical protein
MEHVQPTKTWCNIYWNGLYSKCSVNGHIETFIANYLKKYSCSFYIDNSDCITSEVYNKMFNFLTRSDKIIGTICKRDPFNVLLLPLDDDIFHHGLAKILKCEDLPWEQRLPIAFWRGGRGSLNDLRTNVTLLLHNYINSDVKLNVEDYMNKHMSSEYLAPRCNIETHRKNKYILIIDGTFIASNHQWVFGSGSVPIMITHPDNEYWFKPYLKPMVNYVPIQYDLSDLKEKIEWLIQNDDLAKAISEEAMKLSEEIFTSMFQKKYLIEQIHILCPNLTKYNYDLIKDYKYVNKDTELHTSLYSKLNTNTASSLYELVQQYRLSGPQNITHMFYKEALTKCEPYSEIYYNLMYEFTIFAAYIGLKTIPFELVQSLNANKHIANIYQNMKFYKDMLVPSKVIDLSSSYKTPETFYSSSISILPYEDGYVANVRYVNYTIASGYNTESGKPITLNKYIKLDNTFVIEEEKVFTTPLLNMIEEGIQDVRIFNKNGLIFIGSIANEQRGDVSVCIGKYDYTKECLDYTKIKKRSDVEKNWTFVTFQDELHVVYKWNPLTLCTVENNELHTVVETQLPALFNQARGSTCGFTFEDEIWFIVHLVSYESIRQYYNVFVVFDLQMNLKKYSAPFKFENDSIEYCIGLIIEPTRVIASYSVNDEQTKIAIYDKTYIETKLFQHLL